jgi:DMSO reductase anchor subunit
MHVVTNLDGRSQKGAKVLAMAFFVIAAGLLVASLFIPSPARAGKAGHPPVQAAAQVAVEH